MQTTQTQSKPNFIADYEAAFLVAYPQKTVQVKKAPARGDVAQYHVIIDGDKGDRTLTAAELKEATKAFLH